LCRKATDDVTHDLGSRQLLRREVEFPDDPFQCGLAGRRHARLVPSSTRLAGQQRRQVPIGIATTPQERVGLPLGEPERGRRGLDKLARATILRRQWPDNLRPATRLPPCRLWNQRHVDHDRSLSCARLQPRLAKRWPLHTTSCRIAVDYGKGNREISTPVTEVNFGK